jgi:XTP/dITP diphosphohydrolase
MIPAAGRALEDEMDIYLATNNAHKRDEFVRLFPGHRIRIPADEGLPFDFEEKGESFWENAMGKAYALFPLTRAPVLADDSGLCVAALGGQPGVISHRFGAENGKNLEPSARNSYLLSCMEGAVDRAAYFVCSLILLLEGVRFFAVQETVNGLITEAPRGRNGFGYDPVFLIPETGKTIAELPDKEKDRLSHRGRASRRMLSLMETLG